MGFPEYNLTKDEWLELVTIDYELTWGFYKKEHYEAICKRQAELRKKRTAPPQSNHIS